MLEPSGTPRGCGVRVPLPPQLHSVAYPLRNLPSRGAGDWRFGDYLRPEGSLVERCGILPVDDGGHLIGCVLIHCRQDVLIQVLSDGCAGVSQPDAHDLHGYAAR